MQVKFRLCLEVIWLPPEGGREPASTVVQDPGFLGVVAADVVKYSGDTESKY